MNEQPWVLSLAALRTAGMLHKASGQLAYAIHPIHYHYLPHYC